ncbi:MAG: uroporphyrinogen-III C-methyltransferase [Pseudazoarcus pumilus]|mgnify:CR=1 FL=1|nr:uroporphyrinogen-III C-methyltransferase [Pseudazoarcus pumilus]
MDKQTPALTQPPPNASEEARADEAASAAAPPAGGDKKAAAPAADAPRKPGKLALSLSVLALIGVGVIGWQVYELRKGAGDLRSEVAQRLAEADSRATEMRALSRQAQESIATLQGRFGALESKVAATEGQAAALESLYQEFSRTRSDRVLAEVAQAVTIAAQQLRLAGNYEAALIALQSAEARLAAPELGHLHDLRRALMKDIDAVKSHPQIDVSGMSLRLELLFSHIDRLPLAYAVEPIDSAPAMDDLPEVAPGEGAQGWWSRSLGFLHALGSDAWNEVRGMIRLERMDRADPALLAPSQGVYLRENVKIRLLTARLALLASDVRTYGTDLTMAREWLERYFDTGDAQVQRVLGELEQLAAIDMRAEAPTLTDTFAALGMVRGRSGAPAVESAEPPAKPAAAAAGAAR